MFFFFYWENVRCKHITCGFTGQYAQRNAIHGIKMMVNLYYHNALEAERIPFDGQLTSRLSLQTSGVWVRPRYDTPDGCRLSLTI